MTDSIITLYDFNGKSIEIFELNGTIYFNPRHVGACLDLTDSAVRKAMGRMTKSQVRKLKNSDVKICLNRNLNNAGENFLTESGFYQLAFRSDKAEAQEFTNWVTDIVLPQIRKTGQYITPAVQAPALSLEERTLALMSELAKVVEEQKQAIAIMAPKAQFCDGFLKSPISYTTTQIAEHYGWTAQKLNKFLQANNVQYKQSGQWHLTAKYKALGYVVYETIEIPSKSGNGPTLYKQEMKWTPKGVAWIEMSLRNRGIEPVTPFNVMTTLDEEKLF